ncbi:MAG: hypothetical protein M3P04_05090 [Actinomycetota bacterium]|nr:hypothetical protein [Actinomycetota bacterium]
MNLTDQLHDLVAHEPPYRLDPDSVVTGGRRRRRTRGTALALATGTTAAAVVAGVLLVQAQPPSGRQTLFGGTPPRPAPQGPIETVVRAHTPVSWTFSEAHETVPDGFQADVDDGAGASRLYVGVSPSPGSLQQHPCSDHEFALTSTCREMDLDTDTRLIVRGPAAGGPVISQTVVIVHRDGSGVDVENDNATWPWVDEIQAPATPEQKRLMSSPSVNRRLPVYSLEQMVEIAKAVDAAA